MAQKVVTASYNSTGFSLEGFNREKECAIMRTSDVLISVKWKERRKENVLFNDARDTFYFTVIWRQAYGKGRKEMFYLTTHSTHFILRLYGVRHMVKEGRKCFI